MTLREGVCLNRQSTIIWGRRGRLNRHAIFIVAKKSLIYSLFCSIFGICVGRVLVENVVWGEGLAENVRIPSYREEGSKVAPKSVK